MGRHSEKNVVPKGNAAWRGRRAGTLAEDYQVLQRLSWDDPEAFWPGVLECLRVRFARPPPRCLLHSKPSSTAGVHMQEGRPRLIDTI